MFRSDPIPFPQVAKIICIEMGEAIIQRVLNLPMDFWSRLSSGLRFSRHGITSPCKAANTALPLELVSGLALD
jgi:hypothetical protein